MTDDDNVIPLRPKVPSHPAPVQASACRICGAEAILHQDPDDPNNCRRTVCGVCCGKANRRILDSLRPRKEQEWP